VYKKEEHPSHGSRKESRLQALSLGVLVCTAGHQRVYHLFKGIRNGPVIEVIPGLHGVFAQVYHVDSGVGQVVLCHVVEHWRHLNTEGRADGNVILETENSGIVVNHKHRFPKGL
jgi:hypothetical protein